MTTLGSGNTSADRHLVVHTKEEAAEILRVRVSWLERQAAARKVPFTMLGGCYMFTDDHLAEIVRLNEHATNSPARATGSPRRRQFTPVGNADVAPLRPRPKTSAHKTL